MIKQKESAMTEQEIRAKALEIAVLIQGKENDGIRELALNTGGLTHRYTALAGEIERYIRQEPPFQKQ
jgi:hypothetical protein